MLSTYKKLGLIMTRKIFLLSSTTVSALMLTPSLALAQTTTSSATPDDSAQIIVTGSRIRRDPLDESTPVVIVDQAAIAVRVLALEIFDQRF